MKKITGLIGSMLVLPALTGATALTVPNAFQANTSAVAAQVNENFTAIKTAVDDNDARITGLKTGSGACPGADVADVMVRAGSLCVDKYEASVWNSAAGGTQYGAAGDNYPCPDNGSSCLGQIFARSEAGATPSSDVTWFQALTACASVGKRLPTSAEWQTLARGSGEAGCNIMGAAKTTTGADAACESDFGAADVVGNVWEWTADWVQGQGAPGGDMLTAGPAFGADRVSGIKAAATQGGGTNFPGAINRGGGFNTGDPGAGAYALRASLGPAATEPELGFRCVR